MKVALRASVSQVRRRGPLAVQLRVAACVHVVSPLAPFDAVGVDHGLGEDPDGQTLAEQPQVDKPDLANGHHTILQHTGGLFVCLLVS